MKRYSWPFVVALLAATLIAPASRGASAVKETAAGALSFAEP